MHQPIIRDLFELYAYRNNSDNQLLMLQDYRLDERLEREELNDKIMLDLGERYSYWRHTDLLKTNIDNWFITHEWNIKKLCDTLDLEYNPLYTKDWYEDFNSDRTNQRDTAFKENEKREDNYTDELIDTKKVTESETRQEDLHSTTDRTANQTTENTISAYNSDGYQPNEKSTVNEKEDSETNASNTITTNSEENISDKQEENSNDIVNKELTNDEDRHESEQLGSKLHHYGKENDSSYAEMLEEERKQALFNIYDWIVSQLQGQICLKVF